MQRAAAENESIVGGLHSAHKSGYPASLRSAQIGSRWSPASCTCKTLDSKIRRN